MAGSFTSKIVDFYVKRYRSMAGITEPEPYPALREMLEYLSNLPDEVFSLYGFKREPLRGRVSEVERDELILRCQREGEHYADELLQRFPGKDPRSIAEQLGIRIIRPYTPVGGGRVLFAEFAEPDEMRIYQHAIDKVKVTIEENSLQGLFDIERIENALIAHELYHVVEMEHSGDIFSRTHKITLWHIGSYNYTSGLASLSEITAMSFAKRLTSLPYSPYLLDVLLCYGYNPDTSGMLYNELKKISEARENTESLYKEQ